MEGCNDVVTSLYNMRVVVWNTGTHTFGFAHFVKKYVVNDFDISGSFSLENKCKCTL